MRFQIPESLLAVIIIVAFILCLGSVFYFIRRERRLLYRIQNMLDQAIDGTFQDHSLDESRISAVESSMHRYLSDHQLSREKLAADRDSVQSLISDISHQTATPVANILLYAQLLEEWFTAEYPVQSCHNPDSSSSRDYSSREEAMEMIRAMGQQAEELGFLMDTLIRLSRLEAGLIHVAPKKQKVQPVLSALSQKFTPEAKKKNIRLVTEPSEESAVFDLKWTLEAGANLVENAIKYTPAGGAVRISVKTYTFFTCVSVADDGPGIEEEEQANLFMRFYRGKASEDVSGLGIGLHLARRIMKAQRGYIKLSSQPGEGSIFSLFLPKQEKSQN